MTFTQRVHCYIVIGSELSKAALNQCLTVLETVSDIIETAQRRYVTSSD